MSRKTFARTLRANATDAERELWYHLRARRLGGHKFRRQVPIGPYVVDFLCHERLLIVEVDGGQHAGSEHDRVRDAYLRQRGYRVLRCWNHHVLSRTDAVLEQILLELEG